MSKKGGHLEVQYELLSYGIPLAALPVNADGVGSRAYNCRWLQERRELEKQQRLMETASTAMVTSTTADSQKPTTVTNYTDVVPSSTSTSGNVARRSSPIYKEMLILEPMDNDCVLGRGKAIDQHVGNVRFRHLLQHPNLVMEFENKPKNMKFEFAHSARRVLEEQHDVRFIKENPNGFGWVMADDHPIKEKILRTMRRYIATQKKLQQKQLQQM